MSSFDELVGNFNKLLFRLEKDKENYTPLEDLRYYLGVELNYRQYSKLVKTYLVVKNHYWQDKTHGICLNYPGVILLSLVVPGIFGYHIRNQMLDLIKLNKVN